MNVRILENLIITSPENFLRILSEQGNQYPISLFSYAEKDIWHLARVIKKHLGQERISPSYARKILATFIYMSEHTHARTGKSIFEDWHEKFVHKL